jgi:hypothetical protein
MPYRACDRCDRKVPGVHVGVIDGTVVEMCKGCRASYEGRFTPDNIADDINARRSQFIRERIAFNRRMRVSEARINEITRPQ